MTSSQPLLALIVEDDDAVRSALALVLEDDGYRCIRVNTLFEAREVLRQVTPSIIVLDLMLPGEHGRALLVELSLAEKAPATVLVSGANDAPSIATEFGVLLVRKPFDVSDLSSAVLRACEEARRPTRAR